MDRSGVDGAELTGTELGGRAAGDEEGLGVGAGGVGYEAHSEQLEALLTRLVVGRGAGGVGASPVTVAILPFAADQADFGDLGSDLQTLLTAELSTNASIALVERASLDDALSELELGISGTVDPGTAAEIGYLTGAQILVTGRAFAVQNELVVAAKAIGVETSRVIGATESMPIRGSVVTLSTELAAKLNTLLRAEAHALVPEKTAEEDIVARLQRKVRGRDLPSISVEIPEVSVNRNVPDPAAQTEMAFILQQLGFRLVDPDVTNELADIEVVGEAFSEFGMRKGNLVSSKARVEIKALARESEVVLVDRETAVAVDLSPEIAGKAALARASAHLTERLVDAVLAVN